MLSYLKPYISMYLHKPIPVVSYIKRQCNLNKSLTLVVLHFQAFWLISLGRFRGQKEVYPDKSMNWILNLPVGILRGRVLLIAIEAEEADLRTPAAS